MVDESKYYIEVTQLTYGFEEATFLGRIIENESGEVIFEFEKENEEDVNACLNCRLAYLNECESDNADIPKVDYYQQGGIECKEYLEAKGFAEGFYRGSAIKYITRAGKKCKDTEIQDLEKARDFINFEIGRLKAIDELR